MKDSTKILEYSLQVSYLGILLREDLLSKDEYDLCLADLRKDYGIVSDILADK